MKPFDENFTVVVPKEPVFNQSFTPFVSMLDLTQNLPFKRQQLQNPIKPSADEAQVILESLPSCNVIAGTADGFINDF